MAPLSGCSWVSVLCGPVLVVGSPRGQGEKLTDLHSQWKGLGAVSQHHYRRFQAICPSTSRVGDLGKALTLAAEATTSLGRRAQCDDM